jgi:ferrochelatase
MQKTGVILVNLGTPTAATPAAVSTFLSEFLSDRRVVDLPSFLWKPLLHGLIIPLRRKRVAHAYQSIWLEGGSPLLVYSQMQQQQLQQRLGDGYQVELAMTYGEPSLISAWQRLKSAGIRHVIVVPLYPQYSSTTTAPVSDAWLRVLASEHDLPTYVLINEHYQLPEYIHALASSAVRAGLRTDGSDILLFSFHGIPERYVKRGDPYVAQCQTTARTVAEVLQLPADAWSVSFQSRFGKDKWVEPYTDQTLVQLAHGKPRRLFVICPAFSVDCLETLEEIAVEGRASYLTAGGLEFHYIPALNASDDYITALQRLVQRYT